MESRRTRKGSRAEVQKRSTLLQAIHRAGTAGRLQLSKSLGISNSRVCDLVDSMLAQGLLIEEEVVGNRRGRRGVDVRLNPAAGHWIGMDMEARRLRVVVTDFAGKMVWNRMRPLENIRSGDAFLEQVLSFLDECLADIRPQYPTLRGLGLAASGVTDIQRGVILHYDMLPGVADLPLRDRVAGHTGLPCVMENNIRAMTLAEWTGGAARGLSTFICIAIRSGVGAGVVIDGKLQRGSHGLAGEVGYMLLPGGGPAGEWQTLQQTVSESALGIRYDDTAVAIEPADARRAGELIGAQLASIATVIDPQAILLAGKIFGAEPLMEATRASFGRNALPELSQNVRLIRAELGPFAAAIGAAHLCIYNIPTA